MTADLKSLILALDRSVRREDAWIQFVQHGGDPDESKIVGNLSGYQRLGIEFLNATLRDDPTQPFDVNLDYLVSEESTIGFDWFELTDAPDQVHPAPNWIDRLVPVGCLLMAVMTASMLIVGVTTTIRWLVT